MQRGACTDAPASPNTDVTGKLRTRGSFFIATAPRCYYPAASQQNASGEHEDRSSGISRSTAKVWWNGRKDADRVISSRANKARREPVAEPGPGCLLLSHIDDERASTVEKQPTILISADGKLTRAFAILFHIFVPRIFYSKRGQRESCRRTPSWQRGLFGGKKLVIVLSPFHRKVYLSPRVKRRYYDARFHSDCFNKLVQRLFLVLGNDNGAC